MRVECLFSFPVSLVFVDPSAMTALNPTTGAWDTVPATWIPDAAHLLPMTRAFTAGSLTNSLYADVPAAASQRPGVMIMALATDANGHVVGSPGDALDLIGLDPGIRQVRLVVSS